MKKSEFTLKTAKTILSVIANSVVIGRGMEYRVKIKSNNCYITLHRYGEELCVLLYKSGDIDITFNEFCNGTFRLRYYEFNEDDDFETILKQSKKDFKLLISDFVNSVLDYHILCGCINSVKLTKDDPLAEYKKIRTEFKGV